MYQFWVQKGAAGVRDDGNPRSAHSRGPPDLTHKKGGRPALAEMTATAGVFSQKKTPGIAAGGCNENLTTEDQGRKLRWMRKAADHTPSFAKV